MRSIHTLRVSLSAIIPLILTTNVLAIEEPGYEVIEERDEYEVRRYEPYIVAEVTFYGPYDNVGDRAFSILADYIFGENTTNTRMEMTAPVESATVDSGTKMEMTAPVLSNAVDESANRYRYAFVIESQYTLDSVPKPLDERIRLRQIDARTVAVHRFSGSWRESNFEQHKDLLLDALQRDGIQTIGRPYFARYNAPFVPWFMRRNEVIIEIGT